MDQTPHAITGGHLWNTLIIAAPTYVSIFSGIRQIAQPRLSILLLLSNPYSVHILFTVILYLIELYA